jgi:hypothetical protein
MVKKRKSKPSREWAIKAYVKQGYSSNTIQKKLKKQGLSVRRKDLLAEIRKIKHKKPKAGAGGHKYTPKKHQRMVGGRYGYPSRMRLGGRRISGRQVAVFGHAIADGEVYSARFEFAGSGRELREAVAKAKEGWVPRHAWAFVTVHARNFLDNPNMYGVRGYWSGADVRS